MNSKQNNNNVYKSARSSILSWARKYCKGDQASGGALSVGACVCVYVR